MINQIKRKQFIFKLTNLIFYAIFFHIILREVTRKLKTLLLRKPLMNGIFVLVANFGKNLKKNER